EDERVRLVDQRAVQVVAHRVGQPRGELQPAEPGPEDDDAHRASLRGAPEPEAAQSIACASTAASTGVDSGCGGNVGDFTSFASRRPNSSANRAAPTFAAAWASWRSSSSPSSSGSSPACNASSGQTEVSSTRSASPLRTWQVS